MAHNDGELRRADTICYTSCIPQQGGTRGSCLEAQCAGGVRRVCVCWRSAAGCVL